MSQDARRIDPSVVPGARPAPSLGFIEPCRPALREEAPSGARWVHEIKFDGYRSRIASPEGKVFDGAGRLVAHGSETCLISTVRSGTAGVP
jgi:hypothetical protein